MRFGDEFDVTYDLQCTDFRLPTLTLQPILENAVSYGIRKSEDGTGTVTVRSKDCGDHIELVVIDDGPGFDHEPFSDAPTPEGGERRSHMGLRNVRERLRRVSDGDLIVESAPGKGTKVTIWLPKGEA